MNGSFDFGVGVWGEKEFSSRAPLISFFESGFASGYCAASLDGEAMFESKRQPALNSQSPMALSGPRRAQAALRNSKKKKNFKCETGVPQ